MNATMAQAINQALALEMERDGRIVILGEDVGKDGGVFRITDGLVDKFGADRVIDTPLAESGGRGRRDRNGGPRPQARRRDPVHGIHLSRLQPDHLPRRQAEEQDAGPLHGSHRHPDPLRRRRPRPRASLGEHGSPVLPYPGADRGRPFDALRRQRPSRSRRSGATTRSSFSSRHASTGPASQEVPEEAYEVPLGKARIVREGNDLTIIAWGAMIPVAEKAADLAAENGWSAEIIDLQDARSRWTAETIVGSVKKTGRALVVHEAPRTCGLGAEIAATIGETALLESEGAGHEGDGMGHHAPASQERGSLLSEPGAGRSGHPTTHGVLNMAKEFKFPDVGEGITEGEVVRWVVAGGRRGQGRPGPGRDRDGQGRRRDAVALRGNGPQAAFQAQGHRQGRPGPGDHRGKGRGRAPRLPPRRQLAAPAIPVCRRGRPEPPPSAREVHGDSRQSASSPANSVWTSRPSRGPGPEDGSRKRMSAAPRKRPAGKKPEIRIKAKFDFYGTLEYIPLRGVRRATARRLSESIRKAVHVTHFDEADAAGLVALRKKLKPEAEAKGLKLTYLPFIVRAVVEALKLHPMLNATRRRRGRGDHRQEVLQYRDRRGRPGRADRPGRQGRRHEDRLRDRRRTSRAWPRPPGSGRSTWPISRGGRSPSPTSGRSAGTRRRRSSTIPETAILATMRIAERVRAVDGSGRRPDRPAALPVLRPPGHRRRGGRPFLEGSRPVAGIPGGLISPSFAGQAQRKSRETS